MSPLAAMRIADPARFRVAVRRALRDTRSVPIAARRLGVTPPSLYRWLDADPTLRAGIALPVRGRPSKPHYDDDAR